MMNMYLQLGVGLDLTFAGVYALDPPMASIVVAKIAAVLEPSTARSATTDSAGFSKNATFRTLKGFHDRRPGY